MHFRAKNQRCRGFIASYTIEFVVLFTLYALYLSAALAIARRLDQFSAVSKSMVVLSPPALCFLLSAVWHVFRRHGGLPKSRQSIAANAHLLLLGVTLLAAIAAACLWLASPGKA